MKLDEALKMVYDKDVSFEQLNWKFLKAGLNEQQLAEYKQIVN